MIQYLMICTQSWCMSFLPLPSNAFMPVGVLQFNLILTFYNTDWPLIIRPHKISPTSDANHKSSCYTCFLKIGYKLKLSKIFSMRLINLVVQLTELSKPIYSLDYGFIKKDTDQQPDEGIQRARNRKGHWASMHSECATLPRLPHVQLHSSSPTRTSFWVLWKLHYRGMIY